MNWLISKVTRGNLRLNPTVKRKPLKTLLKVKRITLRTQSDLRLLPASSLLKIDREEVVKLDRSQLPEDITHRGYREVTIQNIIFKTDTVLYRLERMYSESTGKFYEAQLPLGLRGQSYGHELSA